MKATTMIPDNQVLALELLEAALEQLLEVHGEAMCERSIVTLTRRPGLFTLMEADGDVGARTGGRWRPGRTRARPRSQSRSGAVSSGSPLSEPRLRLRGSAAADWDVPVASIEATEPA